MAVSKKKGKIKATPPLHETRLTYFNSDDGVWLDCSCGWEHNLGFNCSAAEAAKLEAKHKRDKKSLPRR
jgi:hypothetical protein